MIRFYKVTFYRLDSDDYDISGYPDLRSAKDKFLEHLSKCSVTGLPIHKYVLRLGCVTIDENGKYTDECMEIQ